MPIHGPFSLIFDLFILIQLLPHLLYPFALLLCRLAVLARALKPDAAQAHVDLVFGVGAVTGNFPKEAVGVAFFEGGDDVGAT